MSADNWTICPKCRKLKDEEKRLHLQKIKDSYGKVDEEAYLKLKETVLENLEDTLREDYEIEIYEDNFLVSYSGGCSVCGFKFEYKYKEKIEV